MMVDMGKHMSPCYSKLLLQMTKRYILGQNTGFIAAALISPDRARESGWARPITLAAAAAASTCAHMHWIPTAPAREGPLLFSHAAQDI